MHSDILDYYNNNWHKYKEEWAVCYTKQNLCFGTRTNNRLENMNKQLKSVIEKYSVFKKFIKNFFILISNHRNNIAVELATDLNKIPTKFLTNDEKEYYNFLLPYAFNQMMMEKEQTNNVKFSFRSDTMALFENRNESKLVSLKSCQCTFFNTMRLPCRHIFKFRDSKDLSLFDEALCLKRWTKVYYLENSDINISNTSLNFATPTQTQTTQGIVEDIGKKLTNHEKFNKVNNICNDIINSTTELSTEKFFITINLLKRLQKQIKNDNFNVELANEIEINESSTSELNWPNYKPRGRPKNCGKTILKSNK